MKFNTAGNVFNLTVKQELPISIEDSWKFLSDPKNLGIITPDSMQFKIISGDDRLMFPGQIIQYKIRMAFGVYLNWVTEITHVEPGSYFVDEQRFGPYLFWHHKHFLTATPNGVLMEDNIDYKVPGWILSKWIHKAVVKPKLKKLFMYRAKVLDAMFQQQP